MQLHFHCDLELIDTFQQLSMLQLVVLDCQVSPTPHPLQEYNIIYILGLKLWHYLKRNLLESLLNERTFIRTGIYIVKDVHAGQDKN